MYFQIAMETCLALVAAALRHAERAGGASSGATGRRARDDAATGGAAAGLAGSDLDANRGMNHGSESGRNVPPRPAPLTFTFQCGATECGAGARAPLARRPRPAAPSRRTHRAPNTPATVTLPGLQWYSQCITGFSLSDSRGESRNRVADKRCASCCARNSRAASHSPAGSVSQAGKWRKRREADARAPQHTYPGLPRQHWILF